VAKEKKILQKMLFSCNQISFVGMCHIDHNISVKGKPFDFLIHITSVKTFHFANLKIFCFTFIILYSFVSERAF